MRLHFTTTASLTIGFAALLTQSVQAAGFYLSEIGTPGSLGTAGVGNPVNTVGADSAWTNPAGMTSLQEDQLFAGAQVVIPKIKFDSSVAEAGGDDGGNAGAIVAIPSFFVVKKMSDRVSLGFSVVAPQGGAMDFGNNFVGRYAATKVELAAIAASSSVAYKVNEKLSLGAGVSIVYTTFEQDIAINQGVNPDGKVTFKDMDDWGYQPFAGVTYYISDDVMLGVVYRAEMDVKLKGDLDFNDLSGPTPPADKIKIGWDNPQTLKAGLSYEFEKGKKVMFSANWEDWSQFSKNQVAVTGGPLNPTGVIERNFKDTWSAGVAFVDWSIKEHGYSVGASYDSSPVSDKNRTIDLPFDETFRLSTAYFWTGQNHLDFGLGATLTYFGEGKVDQTAQGVRFKGKFDTNVAAFLGGTIRYIF
ncbi:MAG: hypothetical protein GQ549_06330 [Gammaproteobacteria bacterium]|nr:hypothetical protein [Gammaproteobacteria bacterium]